MSSFPVAHFVLSALGSPLNPFPRSGPSRSSAARFRRQRPAWPSPTSAILLVKLVAWEPPAPLASMKGQEGERGQDRINARSNNESMRSRSGLQLVFSAATAYTRETYRGSHSYPFTQSLTCALMSAKHHSSGSYLELVLMLFFFKRADPVIAMARHAWAPLGVAMVLVAMALATTDVDDGREIVMLGESGQCRSWAQLVAWGRHGGLRAGWDGQAARYPTRGTWPIPVELWPSQ